MGEMFSIVFQATFTFVKVSITFIANHIIIVKYD